MAMDVGFFDIGCWIFGRWTLDFWTFDVGRWTFWRWTPGIFHLAHCLLSNRPMPKIKKSNVLNMIRFKSVFKFQLPGCKRQILFHAALKFSP